MHTRGIGRQEIAPREWGYFTVAQTACCAPPYSTPPHWIPVREPLRERSRVREYVNSPREFESESLRNLDAFQRE